MNAFTPRTPRGVSSAPIEQEARTGLSSGERTVVVLTCIGILLALVKLGATLFVPLVVAAFLAGALQPIVRNVERLKLSNGVAVAAAALVALLILFGLGVLLALAGADLTRILGRFDHDLQTARNEFVIWSRGHGFSSLTQVAAQGDARSVVSITIEGLMESVPSIVSTVLTAFLIALFLLLESTIFSEKLEHAFQWKPNVLVEARGSAREVQKYLLVKTALSIATGVLLGSWCAVWGLEGAAALGVLAFLLNFIPYVGSLIAAIPPMVIALVASGIESFLGVGAGYVLVNLVIGAIVEPRVLGKALGLSPLVVVISVVVWGWILGPVGALLGVLLTNVAKILLAHSTDFAWLAVVMGPGKGQAERAYVERKRRDSLIESQRSAPRPEA